MAKKIEGTLADNIKRYSKRDHAKIRRYLTRVVDGKEHDVRLVVGKRIHKFECETCHGKFQEGDVLFEIVGGSVICRVPLPGNVRVQAAKALKELQIDKTVADKKDVHKVEQIHDTTKALEDIAERREAEKRAQELGKLKKIGSK